MLAPWPQLSCQVHCVTTESRSLRGVQCAIRWRVHDLHSSQICIDGPEMANVESKSR